jgi:hypothetical protein
VILRRLVLGIALLLLAVGLCLLYLRAWLPGLQLLGLGTLIFAGTAFESWRYRKGPGPRNARWQQTAEKFADPISGEEMDVQYDPVSGERRYVRR